MSVIGPRPQLVRDMRYAVWLTNQQFSYIYGIFNRFGLIEMPEK